ncbi:MAG: glycoside hydrolase family 30 beta sandwich domain-containing protein [Sphingomicrobium sp.]
MTNLRPIKALLVTLAAAVALGAGIWTAGRGESAATITLNANQHFQTMSGWEVSARLWEQNKAKNAYDPTWLKYRDEILDRLVTQVGIDSVRVEVRSGFENPVDAWARFEGGVDSYTDWRKRRYETINDNADPNRRNDAGFHFSELDYQMRNIVLPMRALLAQRGERLHINLCYVDFRPEGSTGNIEHALAPAEYAELILAAFDHLKQGFGITPDSFEIVLEPEKTDHWRGQQIGRALVAVAARLRAAGYRPEFIAPSTMRASSAPEYIDDMLSVPGASGLISMISFHTYDTPWDATRRAIWSRAHRLGATTGMLEHFPATPDEIHRDLTVANVSRWQPYGIAYLDEPARNAQGAYLLLADPSRPRGSAVRLASSTGALAQYFRNVRRGAVRIAASSNNSRKRATAFINRDGSHVVIVAADEGGEVRISGLPSGTYDISFAPHGGEPTPLSRASVTDGFLVARIPAKGVWVARQQKSH